MKILLDECVPRRIKQHFLVDGHECSTVPEAGFAGKKNEELLALAAAAFDVFVTLDKSVQFQQNLSASNIAIIFIRSRSSRVEDIFPAIPSCLAALRSIKRGQVIAI